MSIVGHNDAGKSTLSKLMCDFYKPTKENITLNGQDLVDVSIKEHSHSIGMVMPNPNQMISKAMIYDEVAIALHYISDIERDYLI